MQEDIELPQVTLSQHKLILLQLDLEELVELEMLVEVLVMILFLIQ